MERIKLEGMLKDESLINPHSPYYNNPEKCAFPSLLLFSSFLLFPLLPAPAKSSARWAKDRFGLDTFAFYMCFRCSSPYFGGKKECANLGGAPGAGASLLLFILLDCSPGLTRRPPVCRRRCRR